MSRFDPPRTALGVLEATPTLAIKLPKGKSQLQYGELSPYCRHGTTRTKKSWYVSRTHNRLFFFKIQSRKSTGTAPRRTLVFRQKYEI